MLKLFVLLLLVAASWAAEVCCPEIGCFNDNPPFDGLPLPDCMNVVNPHYTMYTRTNPNLGQELDAHYVPPVSLGYRRTVFIVHGYQSCSESSSWLSSMKDSFLSREDVNVIIVDWHGGADMVNYTQAASNTRTTGAYTALVRNNIFSSGEDYTRMWCIGHGLGAHVCGHCGMRTIFVRITGMDPAGPSFESNSDLTIGLNPSSADFVDVIHTDTTTYGTQRNIGHIDFYPAGGSNQPGCISDIAACSHNRAYEYMENSLHDHENCFQSRSLCNSYTNIPGSCSNCTCGTQPCAFMGYGADFGCQESGIFYLDISENPPYCVN